MKNYKFHFIRCYELLSRAMIYEYRHSSLIIYIHSSDNPNSNNDRIYNDVRIFQRDRVAVDGAIP